MRVSVTDLDSFHRYREREEMTLADLLRIIRREEPPNDKMLAGRALHELLETADVANLDEAECDGHRFRFALDAEVRIGHSREMRGTRDYHIGRDVVTLSGRVDQLDGLTIDDHKLTKNFDAERFYGRYQWRCYLSIFNAQRFNYSIFVGAPIVEKRDDAEPITIWEITDFHELTFWHYPELEYDLNRELTMYVEFARHHLQRAA